MDAPPLSSQLGRGGAVAGAPPTERAPAPGQGGTFDSLRLPLFRWFFLSQMGQSGAMQLQQLLRGYLVFTLTGSFAALGVMSLAQAVPMLSLSLAGGVLADRLPRKHIVQAGQMVNATNAGLMALLVATGWLRVEYLIASAVLQGVVMSLMMPARQAMIPDVVGPSRLMNAIALNSAGMQSMRLFAPGLGGALTALAGADWAYGLTAALYLVAIAAIVPLPLALEGDRHLNERLSAVGDAVRGLRYVAGDPTLRVLLLVNQVTVVLAMPYILLLPGFVEEVLGGGAGELGLMMSITGIGSVAGSLAIASLPDRRRGMLLMGSSAFLGVALLAFSLSDTFWLSALLMIGVGLGSAVRMAASNVLVHAYVEDEYRGRVMSVYMSQFSLLFIGAFLMGLLSETFGVQAVLAVVSAALTVFSLAVIVLVPRMRELQ